MGSLTFYRLVWYSRETFEVFSTFSTVYLTKNLYTIWLLKHSGVFFNSFAPYSNISICNTTHLENSNRKIRVSIKTSGWTATDVLTTLCVVLFNNLMLSFSGTSNNFLISFYFRIFPFREGFNKDGARHTWFWLIFFWKTWINTHQWRKSILWHQIFVKLWW